MTLKDIINFLDENAPNTFLATLGTCGNPRLRPIHSPLLHKNKIYFCTSNEKNLYKHIKAHNGIEFCSLSKEGTFLRLRAEAILEEDMEAKQAMFEKFGIVKEIYQTPSNPKFAIFSLNKISARKQSLDGSYESYQA